MSFWDTFSATVCIFLAAVMLAGFGYYVVFAAWELWLGGICVIAVLIGTLAAFAGVVHGIRLLFGRLEKRRT